MASFATNLTVGNAGTTPTILSFTFGNGGQGKHFVEPCPSTSLTQSCSSSE